MVKLVALYRKPADPEAFMRHYREVHTPLVLQTPGLARLEVSRVTRNPMGGEPAYFLMAEMYYPDSEAFKAAMKSPENAAAGKDLMSFAADVVTMMVAEVDEQ
ncbi:MAG TPA: EthD family reductase [Deinococcales bacterium]|nr:EthD family reductase [Deinococcales bacterium]